MRKIYKYSIKITDTFTLEMPKGAQSLRAMVQGDGGQPQLWALVDPDRKPVTKTFRVIGTGHTIDEEEVPFLIFVDTFMLDGGALVFHLFERSERVADSGCEDK